MNVPIDNHDQVKNTTDQETADQQNADLAEGAGQQNLDTQPDINGEPPVKATSSRKGKKSRKKGAEKVTAELAELRDKNLRLVAEMENLRKRTSRERVEWYKTAGRDVIESLLPILDDFDRAMKALEDTGDRDAALDGIKLIQQKLVTTLQQRGLKQIESIGQSFDPEQHEAISELPGVAEEQKGIIIDQIDKGYTLNDTIIRFPKVIVGK